MQTITKIKLTIATIVTTIALSGCGGGGGSGSFENSATGTAVASCSGALSTWTTVTQGDVVSATQNSQIKFDHDSGGNKKVCVISGNATII